jgi:DNA-binding CsgD family transcriptional regulator
VVELRSGRVGFRHSLLRSVVLADASPRERRAVHRRLADVLTAPFERARHLALSVDGPDDDIAAALDDSAREAYLAGAIESAAELGELAVTRTPPADVVALRRRTRAAADFRFEAGDAARACDLLAELIDVTSSGPQRAELLARLATYHRYDGAPVTTWSATLTSALADAGDDVDLRIRIHLDLGLAAVNGGEIASAPAHITALLALVKDCTDNALAAQVFAGVVWVEFLSGNGFRIDLAQRALASFEPNSRLPVEVRPTYTIAVTATLAGELEMARTLLDAEYSDALRRGIDSGLPFVLWVLTYVETLAGNWVRARQLADHGTRVAESMGLPAGGAFVAGARAYLRAGQGHPADTVAEAARALEAGHELGLTMPVQLATEALGALALAQGDSARAHQLLGPLSERMLVDGLIAPGLGRFVPDDVEALVRLADLEAAERLLTPFGVLAERFGIDWAIAATARCRGLLAVAGGDHPGALTWTTVALAKSAENGMPFEHGRALLVAGEIHRRARRKRLAYDHLTAAKVVFDGLGAVLWSARCRDEVTRTGLRTTRAPAGNSLTTAEQRVADLAAEGYTTKQIAATLFTGTRTVEAHLQRAYRKLSVHSRLELARRLAELGAGGDRDGRPKGR